MPLAHAGHWLVDLLYVAPVLVMGALLLGGRARGRRGGRREADGPTPRSGG